MRKRIGINWEKPLAFIERLTNVIRWLALLATACAVGVMVLWTQLPDPIHAVDNWVASRWENPRVARFRKASRLAREGDGEAAIQELETLRAALAPIGKRAKLYGLKRETLAKLARLYLQANRVAPAEALARNWVAYDNRDVEAHLLLGKILEAAPSGDPAAVTTFYSDLFNRFYNLPAVANQYVAWLLASGNHEEAMRISERYAAGTGTYYLSQPRLLVRFTEAGGRLFPPENRFVFPLSGIRPAERIQTFSLSLPITYRFNGLQELRLDLTAMPVHYTALLSTIRVHIARGEGPGDNQARYEVTEPSFAKGIKVLDDRAGFAVENRDALLMLNLPAPFRGARGPLSLRIEFTLTLSRLPLGTTLLLTDPHTASSDEIASTPKSREVSL